jgi:hypothetical protein
MIKLICGAAAAVAAPADQTELKPLGLSFLPHPLIRYLGIVYEIS